MVMRILIERAKNAGWLRILSVCLPAVASVEQEGIGSILRMAAAIVILSIAITVAALIYQSSTLAIDHWGELLQMKREDQRGRKRKSSRHH